MATILPQAFATFSAYGDFATGLLAILALLTIRIRSRLFWPLVVAYNLVGVVPSHWWTITMAGYTVWRVYRES